MKKRDTATFELEFRIRVFFISRSLVCFSAEGATNGVLTMFIDRKRTGKKIVQRFPDRGGLVFTDSRRGIVAY